MARPTGGWVRRSDPSGARHNGTVSTPAAVRVRRFLLEHRFTADGVLEHVGNEALAGLRRGQRVPVRRAMGAKQSWSLLDRLIELFVLGEQIPASTLVPPSLLAALLDHAEAPIGQRLDSAADAAGLDPLEILGPALTGLRELIRVGIVRTG